MFSTKDQVDGSHAESEFKPMDSLLFFNGYLWNRSEVNEEIDSDVPHNCLQKPHTPSSIDCWMQGGCCTCHANTIQVPSLLAALETDGVVETMRKVDGPWSLVFFVPKENCLWFGRDCFGRKSLLTYDSFVPESYPFEKERLLIISTLHPADLPGDSVEVPVGILHRLNLSDMSCTAFQLSSLTSATPSNFPSAVKASATTTTTAATTHEDFNKLFSLSRALKNSGGKTERRKCDDLIRQFAQVNELEVGEFVASLSRSISCQLNAASDQSFRETNVPETTGATVSVLFSGGVDSLLIAALLGTLVPAGTAIDLLNVAFVGDEPRCSSGTVPDRQTGIKGYTALKLRCPRVSWNLLLVDVTRKELHDPAVQSHVRRLIRPACTVRDESIGCAIWFASKGVGTRYEDVGLTECRRPVQSSARLLFLGSGADELFAGYMRHRSSFAKGGYNAVAAILEEELSRIGHRSLSLCDRVIADHCLLMLLPYLHENFVRHVNSIPIDLKTDLSLSTGIGDKLIVRAALWLLGYEELSFSIKRAIQFGSRIAKICGTKGKGDQRAFV
uniref:Asparagine synthetase domain-containing protein n=1 Tax=Trichuris muris TaxID=70415 RepID=A0A5S6QE43_TRIMR